MASTAEIAKPKNSRLLHISRCFKLRTGGLTNFFVALGFLGLIGDFNSGLIFDLIFGLAFIGLSELTG
jgi:hypothetical protein